MSNLLLNIIAYLYEKLKNNHDKNLNYSMKLENSQKNPSYEALLKVIGIGLRGFLTQQVAKSACQPSDVLQIRIFLHVF